MCCNNNCDACISEILRKILMLQRQDFDNECYAGCDKPFLGPSIPSICYNTRPVQLFNCSTGTTWSFPVTIDGTTYTTNILRVESIDDCCCTCRLLYIDTADENRIKGTNEFCTIDLNCCGAIKCLADVYVDLC